MFHHLIPTDESLFFSRGDTEDRRLGELVSRDPEAYPGAARVVLLGLPQDLGVRRNKGRVGAASAPEMIRSMLYRLTPYDVESGLSIPEGFVFDAGNVFCGGELEEVHARATDVVRQICEAGLVPVVLGGGHDTTYAAASGAFAACGRLGLVNVDAHLDVRPPIPERNSGTSFRMLIEEERIDPRCFVELGIQSFANAQSHVEWVRANGGTIITLDAVRRHGFASTLGEALRIAAPGDRPLYGTLDIDGVRAADAPGVSAAMPDGIAAADLLLAARRIGREKECVALDICEMNPVYDVDNRTAKLAARAVAEFVMGIVERREGVADGG